MKYRISKLVCLILIISCMFQPTFVKAEENSQQGIDVTIVIDTSGSMKSTDPNRIAIDAAKLFIDMMEMQGSRVGLVSFSDGLNTVVDVTPINSVSDKNKIKDQIDALSYVGDTDIGLALKKSYEMVSKSTDSKNKQAILFFTDGEIDLGKHLIRTNDDSLDDTIEVVKKAEKSGIPIYTIGLNADGKLDKNLILDISLETNGRSYVVDKAEDLPPIFDEIFADFINSNILNLGDYTTDGKTYIEVPFTIENENVIEANIVMLSTNILKNIELIDPDGKNIMDDDGAVIKSESKQYTMLKMMTPKKGEWNLKIKGVKGCKVHVNLILNYKIVLVNQAEIVTGEDGTPQIEVTAWMENDGKELLDPELYQAFTGKVYVRNNGTSKDYPMELKNCKFSATVPVSDRSGEFEVYSRIDSDSIYRISDPVTVKYEAPTAAPTPTPSPTPEPTPEPVHENQAPYFHDMPEKIELHNFIGSFSKKKLDLTEYITDPDSETYIVTAEVESVEGPHNYNTEATPSNSDDAEASPNGADSSANDTEPTSDNPDTSDGEEISPSIKIDLDNENKLLTIRGTHKGSSVITLVVTDEQGAMDVAVITVTNDYTFANILPLILIVAAVIAVIVAIVLILKMRKNKNRPFYGSVKWMISGKMNREADAPLGYERGQIPLSKLIVEPSILELGLDKVFITMTKNSDGLEVTNKSSRCNMTAGFGGLPQSKIVILNDEFVMISGTSQGQETSIKVGYTIY